MLILVSLGWVLMLFGVALLGERRGARFERIWPLVYTLSLAVYCTAWTFYGTVTQAARWGAWLPPTFIGTILLFWLAGGFLKKLAALTAEQHSASIADLVATRFGRDSRLAATITAVALIGIVPYIALQLKAVAMSYTLLAQTPDPAAWQDAALWVTLVLAAFALLFGTREAALTAHNRGLILAMGFESLFKLLAMLAVGAYVVLHFDGGLAGLAQEAAHLSEQGRLDGGYLALVGLGAVAMFTLPHQFHLGFVELRRPAHLSTARWLFPLYLLLIALPTLPLAWAGQLRLPATVPSDLYVLALPRAAGSDGWSLLAFLGGLSAATSMVILASLTLSIMLASHWLAPWRLKQATRAGSAAPTAAREPSDLLPTVLRHRRFGVVLVLLLAWLYSRAMGLSEALADIGALSFSALAQLAPAVLAAVYWPGLPARAVFAGIVAGFVAWSWLLLIPTASGSAGWLKALAPGDWLQTIDLDPTARGVLLSLLANVAALLLWRRPPATGRTAGVNDEQIAVSALAALAQRFLPPEVVQQQLGAAAAQSSQPASAAQLAGIELKLAQVVGATSARVLIDAARPGLSAPLESVATLVGEASAQLRFNQQLLEAALQNMSQGISVVDADLKLVAWNRRYAELFGYPAALLKVGTPVRELVAYNAARGLLGTGAAAAAMVRRRLDHMHAGTPYVSERRFPDGTVVEIRGNPMPGGGFVATFTDVTAFRHTEAELKEVNETLEARVVDRTAELAAAKAIAERADQAKTRFLAAVSHDLAQPLHAARLFAHALAPQLPEHPASVQLAQIADALGAAEDQLAALLDISRLDAGGLTPQPRSFALRDLTDPLAAEFAALAREAGLKFRYVPSRAWIHSDPQLLRRLLQNLLANAVRYTREGRVLLGARRRGSAQLELMVLDTGPGIAPADQAVIFEEFRRLDRGGPGLGLGLAIAQRISRLLKHPLTLRSQPGKGTLFGLQVPTAAPPSQLPAPATGTPEAVAPARLATLLVVDNDAKVLAGMQALLRGWGYRCLTASDAAGALKHLFAAPDLHAALLDLHLDDNQSGFDLLHQLRSSRPDLPAVVITADHAESVRQTAQALDCALLHKPLKPLALRSWLRRLG